MANLNKKLLRALSSREWKKSLRFLEKGKLEKELGTTHNVRCGKKI